MEKVISDLLLDIASEMNGYSIGEPWRFTEFSLAAVVPIARVTEELRGYRLLCEIKDEVKVKDTGSIDKLELINNSIHPVLVKAGEVLVGATQSRTLVKSEVLMSEEEVTADCVCIHSSKGIRGGQNMTPTSYSPSPVRRSLFVGHLRENKLADYDYGHDIQSNVWASVNQYSRGLSASTGRFMAASRNLSDEVAELAARMPPTFHTPMGDLAGRISESQERYGDILKKVPKVENQVGICLMTMTGLETMEAFEHPDSWEKIREAILGADSDKISDISDQNGLFEFRKDKAKAIVQELFQKQYESKAVVEKEHTTTYILDEEKFMGEVVILHGKPIHCAFMRKVS